MKYNANYAHLTHVPSVTKNLFKMYSIYRAKKNQDYESQLMLDEKEPLDPDKRLYKKLKKRQRLFLRNHGVNPHFIKSNKIPTTPIKFTYDPKKEAKRMKKESNDRLVRDIAKSPLLGEYIKRSQSMRSPSSRKSYRSWTPNTTRPMSKGTRLEMTNREMSGMSRSATRMSGMPRSATRMSGMSRSGTMRSRSGTMRSRSGTRMSGMSRSGTMRSQSAAGYRTKSEFRNIAAILPYHTRTRLAELKSNASIGNCSYESMQDQSMVSETFQSVLQDIMDECSRNAPLIYSKKDFKVHFKSGYFDWKDPKVQSINEQIRSAAIEQSRKDRMEKNLILDIKNRMRRNRQRKAFRSQRQKNLLLSVKSGNPRVMSQVEQLLNPDTGEEPQQFSDSESDSPTTQSNDRYSPSKPLPSKQSDAEGCSTSVISKKSDNLFEYENHFVRVSELDEIQRFQNKLKQHV